MSKKANTCLQNFYNVFHIQNTGLFDIATIVSRLLHLHLLKQKPFMAEYISDLEIQK